MHFKNECHFFYFDTPYLPEILWKFEEKIIFLIIIIFRILLLITLSFLNQILRILWSNLKIKKKTKKSMLLGFIAGAPYLRREIKN